MPRTIDDAPEATDPYDLAGGDFGRVLRDAAAAEEDDRPFRRGRLQQDIAQRRFRMPAPGPVSVTRGR